MIVFFNAMPKIFTSKTQKVGELGENIACKYLIKNGYVVLDRNFSTRLGEIDIIAEKGNSLYFVEVKSTISDLKAIVSRGTLQNNYILEVQPLGYNPAENVHQKKLRKMMRVIPVYRKEKNVLWGKRDNIIILVVFIDQINKLTKVEVITP